MERSGWDVASKLIKPSPVKIGAVLALGVTGVLPMGNFRDEAIDLNREQPANLSFR